jgi:septin family protein
MAIALITKAKWTTAFINSLPDSAFAVIEPAYKNGETDNKNARHLPHHGKGVTDPNDDSTVDMPHLRNALARVNQIKPVTDSITAEELRKKALAHLQAHAKRLGVGESAEKIKKTVTFKKADTAKHIVYGEVYVPYEKDTDGNWMTPEEIEKMAHSFLENLRLTQIDKQHDQEPDEGVVVESFIARPGDPDFTPGAWVLGTKVLKDDTWEQIMKGEITGYSIEGVGFLIPEENGDQ